MLLQHPVTTQVNETASSNIPLTSSVKSNQVKPTPRVKESKWKIADKLIVYMFIALLSVLGIGFITWQFLFKPRGQVEQLEISLSEPLIELPAPIPPIPESPINQNLGSNLDQTKALSLINQWLEAKKEATGPNYNLAKLNQILTEPQLSLWVGNAKTLRANNAYRRYEHEVEILSAEINPENVSQAIITAIVKEQSQHYVNGALLSNLSYNEELVVDYLLVKEGDQWFIQGIEIVKTN